MKSSRRNQLCYIAYQAFYTTAMLCLTGPMMQTFLGTIVTEKMIYIQATAFQIINVASTILMAHYADRGNLFRRMALAELPIGVLFFLYLPLCFSVLPMGAAFGLALALSGIQAFFTALYTVCAYKLPYQIVYPNEYGRLIAVSGVVYSLLSLGVGALVSFVSARFPYGDVMKIAFPVAGLFVLAAVGITLCMRRITDDPVASEQQKAKVSILALFRMPEFYKLAPANLLRGFSTGTVTVLAAVALTRGFDATVTSAMVSVQSAVTIAASVLFGLLAKTVHSRFLTFAGSVLFLALPLMLFSSPIVFLCAYGLVFFGKIVVDSAVPTALLSVVPEDASGPYHAWRMILHNGGSVIATSVAVFLPVPALLILSAALQLVSGFSYLIFRKKEI